MATLPDGVRLTWLGHATFLLEAQGKRVLIDPWLRGNPACPDDLKDPGSVDVIAITHGHNDHMEDAMDVAKRTGATVVAIVEIGDWLETNGVENVVAMNKGGTAQVGGIKFHMTDARHSSTFNATNEGGSGWTVINGGEAAGFVIELETGYKLYHAGDTCVFGDMALIRKLLAPDIALLPIGDFYTMGPRSAAEAVRLLGVKTVVPMHYGTFPVLVGTPDELRKEADDVDGLEVVDLKPGDSIGST
ncbi:MAG TPA: metal-dependent hydrolase [Actinomycetota bacterium]|nr:metal-dependent hydrolase [Actinomycetota bacterium]